MWQCFINCNAWPSNYINQRHSNLPQTNEGITIAIGLALAELINKCEVELHAHHDRFMDLKVLFISFITQGMLICSGADASTEPGNPDFIFPGKWSARLNLVSVHCEPPELNNLQADIPRIATFLFKRAFLDYSAIIQDEYWVADVNNGQWQANCTIMQHEVNLFVCVVGTKPVAFKMLVLGDKTVRYVWFSLNLISIFGNRNSTYYQWQHNINELRMQVKLLLQNNKTFKVVEVIQLFKEDKPHILDFMPYLARIFITRTCELAKSTHLDLRISL